MGERGVCGLVSCRSGDRSGHRPAPASVHAWRSTSASFHGGDRCFLLCIRRSTDGRAGVEMVQHSRTRIQNPRHRPEPESITGKNSDHKNITERRTRIPAWTTTSCLAYTATVGMQGPTTIMRMKMLAPDQHNGVLLVFYRYQ
jgi:hypothetical protein